MGVRRRDAAAGDRGLCRDGVRGETFPTYQLRVHRMVEGTLCGMVMASVDLLAAKHAYVEASPPSSKSSSPFLIIWPSFNLFDPCF